ncbi:hypothetical protein FA95DRAFT_1578563 [Auriscalpium vulgare]|uniref:Uncharacterized protein n=1 Tax=Auriscalpium vulgare TaxID=40419 RepID=A0ACB8R135_9AGAM|nr:hypothetical protein FA95DRAFT_1578563 [Auriscalpium vulgare]
MDIDVNGDAEQHLQDTQDSTSEQQVTLQPTFDPVSWLSLLEALTGSPHESDKVFSWKASDGMLNTWRNRLTVNVVIADGQSFHDSYMTFPGMPSTAFSVDVMGAEFDTMLVSFTSMRAQMRTPAPTKPLHDALVRLGSHTWHSESAVRDMSSAWHGIKTLEGDSAVSTLNAIHARYQLMLNHMLLWTWLESVCARYSFPDKLSPKDGLTRLALALQRIVEGRIVGETIDPSSFHPSFPQEPYLVPMSSRAPRITDVSPFAKQKRLYDMLFLVLRKWVNFPEGTCSLAQSWLLGGLTALFGMPVLLLGDTYNLYLHVMRDGLNWRRALSSPSNLMPFFISLKDHPMRLTSSQNSAILHAMQRLHARYSFSNFDALSLEEEAMVVKARTRVSPDDMDITPTSRTHAGTSPPSSLSALSPSPTPSASANSGLLSATMLPVVHRKLNEVARVLRLLAQFIDAPAVFNRSTLQFAANSQDPDTRLLHHVSTNLDKFLPFRERAPSVRRIRRPEGPFTPERLRTRIGFFSALVFRTLTFGTDYFFEQLTVIPNGRLLPSQLAAWSRTLNIDHGYFVNNTIYGNCQSRDIADAPVLWAATAKERNLPFPLTQNIPVNPIPFNGFYKTVTRKEKAERNYAQRIYPQCGPLIGYLLTADYVYTGLVEMPSVDLMGSTISKINLGSCNGLRLLRLLDGLSTDIKAPGREARVQAAFAFFYGQMSARLMPDEQAHMGWDVITAEHLLCKISRMYDYLQL